MFNKITHRSNLLKKLTGLVSVVATACFTLPVLAQAVPGAAPRAGGTGGVSNFNNGTGGPSSTLGTSTNGTFSNGTGTNGAGTFSTGTTGTGAFNNNTGTTGTSTFNNGIGTTGTDGFGVPLNPQSSIPNGNGNLGAGTGVYGNFGAGTGVYGTDSFGNPLGTNTVTPGAGTLGVPSNTLINAPSGQPPALPSLTPSYPALPPATGTTVPNSANNLGNGATIPPTVLPQ